MGIDGCKTGWIAVVLRPDREVEAHYLASIEHLSETVPDARVVAIDIPIGLPDEGRRQADIAARLFLGLRRNSVFFAPVREAVEALSHSDATAASTRRTGMGISQQSYALSRKIIEVERWLPQAPCPVFEVHPEVSFALMTGEPARSSKKSWAGMIELREAFARLGMRSIT